MSAVGHRANELIVLRKELTMPKSVDPATTELTARGPFDLAASIRFLEGFTPANQPVADGSGLLRLAFPAEVGWAPVGAAVRQHGRAVSVELSGDVDDPAAVVDQVERILSLDVDGSGFLALGRRDPVVGDLQARYPGLRPVQFHSPYEAACWAIIGQRIRITQAAAIRSRIADECGHPVTVAGQRLPAFPGPEELQRCSLPAPRDQGRSPARGGFRCARGTPRRGSAPVRRP